MAQASDNAEDMITGINVTPLVDVVLVLLVVLMVTASYIAAHAIPVELPKAATGEVATSPLAISVNRAGAMFVDGAAVDDAAFRARVRHAHDADPQVRAVIAADADSAHHSVVHVIDLLRREQVTRFALNVNPEVLAHAP